MKKISNKELKKICFDMLIELTKFLEENNLRYILDYGTLLGCIRHKGFIPWDDDIDIAMPREDYDKLYSLLKKRDFSLTDNYKLSYYNNKYNTYKNYFTIVDITTICESPFRKEKYWFPIWIDIFPYDYISKNKKWENIKRLLIEKLNYFGTYPVTIDKNLKHKIIGIILKPFVRFNYWLVKILIKIKKDSDIMHNYVLISKNKNIMYMDYFDNYIYKEFEGNKFRIPKKYDERLKSLYGDYMKLPPENERIPHVVNVYKK